MSFCVFCESDNAGAGCWLDRKKPCSLLARSSFNKRQDYEKHLATLLSRYKTRRQLKTICRPRLLTHVSEWLKMIQSTHTVLINLLYCLKRHLQPCRLLSTKYTNCGSRYYTTWCWIGLFEEIRRTNTCTVEFGNENKVWPPRWKS